MLWETMAWRIKFCSTGLMTALCHRKPKRATISGTVKRLSLPTMPPCGTDWVRIKRSKAPDDARLCLGVVDVLRRLFGAGVSCVAAFESFACTTQNIQMHSDASNTSTLNGHLCSRKPPFKIGDLPGLVAVDMSCLCCCCGCRSGTQNTIVLAT